jgi:exportin-2 (importin alpha re-exporter)
MFGMVVERLFVAEVQRVSGTTERKICAVGITKLLTECPAMMGNYENLW